MLETVEEGSERSVRVAWACHSVGVKNGGVVAVVGDRVGLEEMVMTDDIDGALGEVEERVVQVRKDEYYYKTREIPTCCHVTVLLKTNIPTLGFSLFATYHMSLNFLNSIGSLFRKFLHLHVQPLFLN